MRSGLGGSRSRKPKSVRQWFLGGDNIFPHKAPLIEREGDRGPGLHLCG